MTKDVFISHASEDKDFVRLLASAIEAAEMTVWLDELQLRWGSSLGQSIDEGLKNCRYGIVVLSPDFFVKKWPERELRGLVQRQISEGRVVVLPIYHDVSHDDVVKYSPTLADALAVESNLGAESIAIRLKELLGSEVDADVPTAPSSNASDPMSEVKRLLRARDTIGVGDLLQMEGDAAIAALKASELDPNQGPTGGQELFDEFKRRVARTESAVTRLTSVQMAIAFYGDEEYAPMLRRSLERLAALPYNVDETSQRGYPIWLNLQKYAPLLAFYRVLAAAVAGDRWAAMRGVLFDAQAPDGPLSSNREPMLFQMRPTNPFGNGSERDQWLRQDAYGSTYKKLTPAPDHLADQVAASLAPFGFEGEAAKRIFDVAFFMAQMAYHDLRGEQTFLGFLSPGQWWRVVERFHGWENTPQAKLVEKVQREGDASPILRSGVSSGSSAAFVANAERIKEKILAAVRF